MTNANDGTFGYGFTTADGSNHAESFGLTKREYFAAMAMQGMLANDWQGYSKREEECDVLARCACNYADALINELNK